MCPQKKVLQHCNAIWLKTFYEKAIGTSITEDDNGYFYVSGYNKDNGHTILVKIQDLGNTAEPKFLKSFPEMLNFNVSFIIMSNVLN